MAEDRALKPFIWTAGAETIICALSTESGCDMRGMTAFAFMTFILVACDDQRGEQHSDAGPLHTPTVSAGLGRVEGLGVFEALMPYLVMEKGFELASYYVLRTKPLRFPSGRIIAADGIMLCRVPSRLRGQWGLRAPSRSNSWSPPITSTVAFTRR
jgi:hypothetical protein